MIRQLFRLLIFLRKNWFDYFLSLPLYSLQAYLLNHMKLSVITVTTLNVASIIGAQIESVRKHLGSMELEQIIVDNGSADNIKKVVAGYPEIKFIENGKNLGFGAANNIGYKIATGDYILFLNPDNQIVAGTLEQLCQKMEQNKEVGLLSVKLIHLDGSFNDGAKPRRYPKLFDQLLLLLKLPHLFPKILDHYLMKDFNPEIEQEVDTVRGAFMLVRKQTLDKLGFAFDPRYFIWFEDVDLCREVKKMGLKVVYTPAVSCVDLVGQSFKQQNNLWKQKIFTASMVQYFQKWEPWYKWIWIVIFRPVAIFLVWFKGVLKKKEKEKIKPYL